MTGSLSVGNTHFTKDQVEAEIARLSVILRRLAKNTSDGKHLPILIDFSPGSHLLLAAASRLSLSCALIDSTLPMRQVQLQLRQLQSRVIYFLPNTKPQRMSLFSGIRYRNIENVRAKKAVNKSSDSEGSVVLFSSGSTGDPKGVVFNWRTIHEILDSTYRPESSQGNNQRVLNMHPLNWTVGFFQAISINKNVDLISLNPLSVTMSQLIEQFRFFQIESIYLGANFARVFAKAVELYRGPELNAVKKFVIGSGAISWELVNKFKRIIPNEAEFVHSYASTEAVGMLASSWVMGQIPTRGRVALSRFGRAEGLILEATGQEGVFEVLATQRIAQRYLSQRLTSEKFITGSDGTRCWRSGDLVSVEGESKELYFHGRVDDIVKNSDHLVSLFALEREINSLRGVVTSVVRKISIPNRDVIVAFVQVSTSNPASEARVLSALRKRLPSYSIPHRVIVCDQIPLTNRGKPDLHELKTLYFSQ